MLTLLLSTGVVQVWHAYMAILITGACWALDTPSRRAVIYDLLGLEGVTNAVALDSVGMNASRMCGPALAGVLITLTGVTGGYVVLTFFAALPGCCCGRCAYRKGHAQSVASRVSGVICSRASASCAEPDHQSHALYHGGDERPPLSVRPDGAYHRARYPAR